MYTCAVGSGHLSCCARVNTGSLLPVQAWSISQAAISITSPSDPAISLKHSMPMMLACFPILTCEGEHGGGGGRGLTRALPRPSELLAFKRPTLRRTGKHLNKAVASTSTLSYHPGAASNATASVCVANRGRHETSLYTIYSKEGHEQYSDRVARRRRVGSHDIRDHLPQQTSSRVPLVQERMGRGS